MILYNIFIDLRYLLQNVSHKPTFQPSVTDRSITDRDTITFNDRILAVDLNICKLGTPGIRCEALLKILFNLILLTQMILILLTWFKGLDLGPLIVILMLPRQCEWISITKSSSVCKHSDPQFLLWDETTKQKNLGIALFHILILLCHRCQNRTSLDGPYLTVHGIVPSTFYDVTISDHPPT